MTKESLLKDIYPDVCTSDYCSVCFRTSKERRLLEGKNLAKFKYFRQSTTALEVREDITKYSDQKICYMCDAQAVAANKFCMAMNLSHHLHNLFHQMKRQPTFATQVINHLTNDHNTSELKYGLRNLSDLQSMLEQLRKRTTLLQTETLLLNNTSREASMEEDVPPPTGHESFRDLLTFEPQTELDDALFHLAASVNTYTKQIIIEDDDPIKEEPPDPNMFIIPDKLPSTASQSVTQSVIQTDNVTGYLLHPIVVNNGSITIPSLDKNISINDRSLIVNGLTDNTKKISSLNQFVGTPITKTTPQNTNKNSPNMKFVQNTNNLAENIISLVQNPITGQNTINFRPKTGNIEQNTENLRQNKSSSTQKTSNTVPYVLENTVNVPSLTPVKVTASPVKRSDSDSNTDYQNIQPIRKPDRKIDWEDKIPMDVISFVSPSDPTTITAKRQKVTEPIGFVTSTSQGLLVDHRGIVDHQDPMGKCVITDVKSVREYDVIDLC